MRRMVFLPDAAFERLVSMGSRLNSGQTYLKAAQGVNSCADPHKRLAAHQQE